MRAIHAIALHRAASNARPTARHGAGRRSGIAGRRSGIAGRESGIALVTVVMITALFSLMLAGFFLVVNGEQQIAANARDHTQTFYGAEAGLEKMSSDLAAYFQKHTSPTLAELQSSLTEASDEPAISGIDYPAAGGDFPDGGYSITAATPAPGTPGCVQSGGLWSCPGTIGGTGPLAGLQGVITPLTLSVVAQGVGQSEVKMSRMVQEVAVPVFEFGIFSNTDLSFFAGEPFNFGGRVHANGNLYLAEQNDTLTLGEKVSTAGQVITTELENGCSNNGSSGGDPGANQSGCETYEGTVDVDTAPNTYRALAMNEGSLTGALGSSPNPNWQHISLTDYNGNIVSATTGGKTLNMALAFSGVSPIEILRRPLPTDDSTVSQARLYNQASLIILLSDNPDELPQIAEPNAPNYGLGGPVPLDAALVLDQPNSTLPDTPDTCHAPVAQSSGTTAAPGYLGSNSPAYTNPQGGTSPDFLPAGAPLLGGYIEILMQDSSGVLHNVTQEIIDQGIASLYAGGGATYSSANPPSWAPENSCAYNGQTYYPILEMESLPIGDPDQACAVTQVNVGSRRRPQYQTTYGPCAGEGDLTPTDYVPLNMFDSREGNEGNPSQTPGLALNGVMGIMQLNVQNLQKWFAGQITSDSIYGDDGPNALNNGGYIVYFSDRRGLRLAGSGGVGQNQECATINGSLQCAFYGDDGTITAGVNITNGIPDPAYCETGCMGSPGDEQPSEELYNYTAPTVPDGLTLQGSQDWGAWLQSPTNSLTPWTVVDATEAEDNPPIFFRRALRLVNGQLGNLPPLATADCSSATAGGFTVASENPVYVRGDYNADWAEQSGNFADQGGQCHVPAAVMADAVTVLSGSWSDAESFNSPGDAGGRPASNAAYRMAVLGGTNEPFLRTNSNTAHDFGTDGGVHNFLRYLEDWSGTLAYDGSFVEMFHSFQATSVYNDSAYNGNTIVYNPPTRAYQFDTDFNSITTLPPGTPRFTDVNDLSYQQDLLPGQ
ncbi:MAG: PilX N-terminal domain-containing pilus assembly protein [Terriglobales bacterium]